jgi:hypothetical protein
MNYEQLKKTALTGDLILVEGKGAVGRLIRVVTGQQMSHVAVLMWLDGGLWVAEMREFHGFSLQPASQRLPEMARDGLLYHACAPQAVHDQPEIVIDAILRTRDERPRYSYWTLLTVWLSQLLERKIPGAMVCSTFAQRLWERCHIAFDKSADPGDFVRLTTRLTPLVLRRDV